MGDIFQPVTVIGFSRAAAIIVFTGVARLGRIVPCKNLPVVDGMVRAHLVILARAPDVVRGWPFLLDRPFDGRSVAQIGLERFAVELRINVHADALGQNFRQLCTKVLIHW